MSYCLNDCMYDLTYLTYLAGILPKFLGHRNAYGAPTFGVLLSASGVICLGWLSFAEVIDMLNLLFCYGQVHDYYYYYYYCCYYCPSRVLSMYMITCH